MRNYQCKKCKVQMQSKRMPNTSKCPEGSMHQWINLGDAGSIDYQCIKCSTTAKFKSRPSSSLCPSGSMHQWNKL